MYKYPIRVLLKIVLIFFIICFYALQVSKHYSNESYFGTIFAPYSDPLGPWLHGGITYYLDEIPLTYLYRPSVGVYVSSFLTLGNFYWIPYFILFYFLFQMSFLLYVSSLRLCLAGLISLLYFGVFHSDYFPHINPFSISPDFFSFHLTFMGIFAVLVSLEQRRLSLYTLGMFHMGLNVAIRGIQLPGLFVLYILGLFWFYFKSQNYKKKFFLITLGFILSFLPVFTDGLLRKKYNIVNNLTSALYCIYEYNYAYSDECFAQYLKLKMNEKDEEVYKSYVNYILTDHGINLVREFFVSYFKSEVDKFFQHTSFLTLILLISLLVNRNFICLFCRFKQKFMRKNLLKYISLNLIVFLSIFSFYLFGLIMFALLFSLGGQRPFTTLSPAFVFSLFYFLFPSSRTVTRRRYDFLSKWYVFLTILVLFLLLFSNFVFPKPFAKEFKKRNEKENVIFKISDDKNKGVSLWYGRKKGNSGVLYFYTSIDPRPKWKIYSFEKLETEVYCWSYDFQEMKWKIHLCKKTEEGQIDRNFSISLLKIYFKE